MYPTASGCRITRAKSRDGLVMFAISMRNLSLLTNRSTNIHDFFAHAIPKTPNPMK
jgi:hypothetical protein